MAPKVSVTQTQSQVQTSVAFERLFNIFWTAVEKKIDDASEIRQLFYDTFKETGVFDNSKIVFVPVGNVVKVSNYHRFMKCRGDQLKATGVENLKDRRHQISLEWKAKSVEEKGRWNNNDGTGVYVPKLNKRHSNGYNLFTKHMAKDFAGTDVPAGERFHKTSEAWHKLSDNEREKWNHDARELALRSGKAIRARSTTTKKLSGYNLYIRERSTELKAENKSVSLPNISVEWKSLTPEAQGTWNVRAKALNPPPVVDAVDPAGTQ